MKKGDRVVGASGGSAYANGSDLPISLVIPGQPEYLALCRLVAGAIGVQEAADEETIADLKLIVTEACNCFLDKEGSGANNPSISVEFASLEGALVITVTDPEGRFRLRPLHDEHGAFTETGLALTIMRALADDVDESMTASGGSVLRLVKHLPSPPSAR